MIAKEDVFKAISNVIDPEVGFNLVEMGLIYNAVSDDDNNVLVTMTLSTRACPLHQMMIQWVEEAVMKYTDAASCRAEVVWEPEWSFDMADQHVKDKLNQFANRTI
jgi:metal-sulfur cluster biosynthetic enzyme